jgi:Na+/melibiose symporter-like transporter
MEEFDFDPNKAAAAAGVAAAGGSALSPSNLIDPVKETVASYTDPLVRHLHNLADSARLASTDPEMIITFWNLIKMLLGCVLLLIVLIEVIRMTLNRPTMWEHLQQLQRRSRKEISSNAKNAI